LDDNKQAVWQGEIQLWRKLLKIAVPLMAADSINSILWLTDTYFVGRLGDYAVEGIGIGGYLTWLAYTLASPLYVGSLVLTAQAYGSGDKKKAERIIGEGVTLALLLAVPLLLVLKVLTPPLVGLIAGPRVSVSAKVAAVSYFNARIVGLPFLYTAIVLDSAYRGAGITRPVFHGTLLFSVVNAVLDPILIYGLFGLPRMGVSGAGLASAISVTIYTIYLLLLLKKSTGIAPKLYLPRAYAGRYIKLGAPALAERIGTVIGFLPYTGAIARCGDRALAAHTIGLRIESLAFLPLFSLGEATASIVGQKIGAGKIEEAGKAASSSARLALIVGSIIGVFLAAASTVLPRPFTRDPATLRLASIYLALAGASEPLLAGSVALLMSIRAGGETRVPMIVTLSTIYTFRVALAILLIGRICGFYCPITLWSLMVMEVSSRFLLSLLLFKIKFYRYAKKIV